MSAPSFDAEDLGARLDHLSEAELNRLPFGVIRLDDNGKVAFYSETEARNSGRGQTPTLGLSFFGSVAPCMAEGPLARALQEALGAPHFDIEVGHTGDYEDPARALTIRAIGAPNGLWIVIQRES